MGAATSVITAYPAIHLWTLVTPTEDHAQHAQYATHFTPWLSQEEQTKYRGLRRPADQQAYLAAHGLLRFMLGQALGIDPASVMFEAVASHSKPTLAAQHRQGLPRVFDFNISHTAGLVACAISTAPHITQLGVDTENLHRHIQADALPLFCHPAELAVLQTQAGEEWVRTWVTKEAIAKACGQGLALDLSTLHVQAQPPALLAAPSDLGTPSEWHCQAWQTTSEHWVTLAYCQRTHGLATVPVLHQHLTAPP